MPVTDPLLLTAATPVPRSQQVQNIPQNRAPNRGPNLLLRSPRQNLKPCQTPTQPQQIHPTHHTPTLPPNRSFTTSMTQHIRIRGTVRHTRRRSHTHTGSLKTQLRDQSWSKRLWWSLRPVCKEISMTMRGRWGVTGSDWRKMTKKEDYKDCDTFTLRIVGICMTTCNNIRCQT
jgi:hypothetical protein